MRCKVGDLAEIVSGALGGSPNKGKIVEVVRLDGQSEEYGPIWYVVSRTMDLITEYGGLGKDAHCADDWLRPIKMPEPPAKTKDKELVHE